MHKPLKIQKRLRSGHGLTLNHQRASTSNAERLVAAAIVRDGICHHGHKSHGAIRAALGDINAYDPDLVRPNDNEGFWTSHDRFVTRDEAKVIGANAGQCTPTYRKLLSSDITW